MVPAGRRRNQEGGCVYSSLQNTNGQCAPREPALLVYRPEERTDPAVVEGYAIAFGLRVQRSLADQGTYAPVVIDRPAALSNILAEIEGAGTYAGG